MAFGAQSVTDVPNDARKTEVGAHALSLQSMPESKSSVLTLGGFMLVSRLAAIFAIAVSSISAQPASSAPFDGSLFTLTQSSDPMFRDSVSFRERYSWGRNSFGGITVTNEGGPRVYVLDTGVGIHEDLFYNVLQRINLNTDPTTNTPVNPVGCYAHATHVAGIIGARRGNRGVAGMAAGAKIISVSVAIRNGRNPANSSEIYDCGMALQATDSEADINLSYINAMNWIKADIAANSGPNHNQTAIVNISFNAARFAQGSTIALKMLDLATPAAGYPGALVVQSAGNEGSNACAVAYGPQNDADGILVVGGIRETGGLPIPGSYTADGGEGNTSNTGPCVEVYAPSVLIWSTYGPGPFYYNDSTYWQMQSQWSAYYRELSGTSMAAPHISGLAVGFLIENPTLSPSALETQMRTRAFYQGPATVVARSPFTEEASWDALIAHYYLNILNRSAEQDPQGKAFWNGEIARFDNDDVDVREVIRAMGKTFFFSQDYESRARTNSGFLDDMYFTFYQRAADVDGKNYWLSQMDAGLNREAVFLGFAFSPEFQNFMTARLGYRELREEVSFVIDAYRGALGRLPDPQGYRYWRDRLRAAQCQGNVWNEAYTLITSFFQSTEAAQRGRTNRQYVTDNYDGFFRAPPDAPGLNYWTQQLDSGSVSRPSLTSTMFTYSGPRISRMASLPCIPCTNLMSGETGNCTP